ncbi:hypothetical protein Ahy_A07g032011 isoform A [Arachis hypogaea]|uniref:Glycosyltransferase n=1 Tax=Arachis hypogaea TaxID=3818 RepID=A0A445C5V8_ARAHY|nr:hypothetical protein Ahy_A07g032011 isoform A [Arachis hypogaea]
MEKKQKQGVRLVLLPLPLQGHINPMLQLANILYSKGFSITIIHTTFNSPNPLNYPHFTFFSIQDGITDSSSLDLLHLVILLNIRCVTPFRDMLAKVISDARDNREPVACLISDALFYFTQAVSNTLELPRIVLRTSGISSFVPFLERLHTPTRCVTPFRDTLAKVISDARDNKEHVACLVSDGLFYFTQGVSNTFELPRIALREGGASSFVPFVLFPLLIERGYIPIQDSQLEETVTEIPPLKVKDLPLIDTKEPEKYYKELSNLVEAITAAKFLEIAWGLASSMHPFLWVIRKGMVIDDGKECLDPPFPAGFIDNLEGRGYIVKWAPQQEVLAHKAVGAFWTHCGWNSTLESICEGVPMICMPFFTDQKVNARYVSSVWKIGVQFEGEVKREEVVKMIRGLIEGNNKEGSQIRERVLDLKEKARVSWNHGGSSYTYLDALVNFILSFEPKR